MSKEDERNCLKRVQDAYSGSPSIKKIFDNSKPEEMKKILDSCKSNPDSNAFPDFLFDGGIMEHFEVSSSKEGRKGSQYRTKEYKEGKRRQNQLDEAKSAFLSSEAKPGTFQVVTEETIHTSFSYEDFLKSLRKNIEKHILSLRKYELKEGVVTFLMEDAAGRICIYENGSFARFYELNKDKRALEILKEFSGQVRYFIGIVLDALEIIDIERIDELLLRSKDNLDAKPGRTIIHQLLLLVDF